MKTDIPPLLTEKEFKQTLAKAKSTCLSHPIEGIANAKTLYAEMKGAIDALQEAQLIQLIGIGHHVAKDYLAALKYYRSALEVFEREDSFANIAGTQNWMSLSYNAIEETEEALKLLFRSLELCQKHQLTFLEFRTHTCLGAAYQSIYNAEKAIESFEKALLLSPESERAIALSNLASIYSNQANHQQALDYLKEAYHLKNDSIIPMNHAYIATNMVICLGEVHDYEAILPMIGELEAMAETLKDTIFIHLYFTCLMGLYLRCREADKTSVVEELMTRIDLEGTLVYLKEKTESADTDNLRGKLNACDLLVAYYELDEDWRMVSYYQKKLLVLNGKKFEKDKMEATERLLVKHEVAQKEQKIKIQELELEKKEALEKINQQLEEKVAKRTAKLTLQNQQLREFAFIVSHDLREPLCNIHGITHLLTETYQDELKGDMEVFLTQIGSSAEYMNRLLKDLLDYTILEKKIEESGFHEVDCMDVFKEVKQSLALQIKSADALIEVGSLPKLNGSGYAIRLLFEQLFSNALKFKSPKRPCHIQLKCIEKPDCYQFSVKDNGIGMDKTSQQRIFRVFQRLNRHDYGGTGIGLAICRKTIQLLEGEIFVESELGIGSTFSFTVPKK